VLFVVAMDTVHATVGTVNEVLGESDEAYSHMAMALSYRRLRAYIDDTLAQIRSFCARDEDCIHFEKFCGAHLQPPDQHPLLLCRSKAALR